MSAAAVAQSPAWNQWRGAARDGVAAFRSPASWPAALTKKWEIDVGLGHASPVVSGSRVILHAREGDRETVSAFDLESGKRLWHDAYAAPYTMNPAARGHGPGPKSTPVVAGGRVFTLGISGILSALDEQTGKLLWRTDEPDVLPLYGTAMSPIAEGNLVIAHVGGHGRGALTAFDAATGRVRWRWAGDGPGYASPIAATFAGTRQIVTQSQNHLVGVAAADGTLLWQVPLRTNYDQNSVTPLVVNDLLISSGLENPTIAFRIARRDGGWAAEEVWRNERVSMYMSSPAANGATLFGLSHRNRGQFFAMDLATGQTLWTTRGREAENASIVRAGNELLLFTTNAELIVARASTAGFEEIRRYPVADSAVWAHPAVLGSRILVKDVDTLIHWTVTG